MKNEVVGRGELYRERETYILQKGEMKEKGRTRNERTTVYRKVKEEIERLKGRKRKRREEQGYYTRR